MNININNLLKSADTKFAPQNKRSEGKDEPGESFLKSFNKLIEKKRLDSKKKLEGKVKDKVLDGNDKEEVENPKDLKGYLNASYLIQSYPEEKTLNSEISLDSVKDILIAKGEGGEELFQEATLNTDKLLREIEAEVLGLGGEVAEPFPEIDQADASLKEVNNLNFSVEEAKANLSKALNKEVNTLETEVKLDLEAVKDGRGLEGAEDLEVIDQLIPKESPMVKANQAEKNTSKGMEKPGNSISGEVSIPTSKLESVEGLIEENNNLLEDDPDSIKKDEIIDKDIGQVSQGNAKVEDPKLADANILFNRIQNSILGFEENSDTLSPQNIQSVEDSMIEFMKVSKEGDASVMKVRLYPEELGSIDISLKLDKGKLIADIIVASDKIKEMFLDNAGLLNRNLVEANLPIKNINIRVQDTFANLENTNGETQDGQSRGNSGQGQRTRRNAGSDINNSPIDNMRIETINKRNIGSNSLNILV